MAQLAIHRGEQLAKELKTLDMSAAKFARRLGLPTNRVTTILNGRRAVRGDTALRLAHFFGTTPQFWLNLQALYDLRLAEKKAPQEIIEELYIRCMSRKPVLHEKTAFEVLLANEPDKQKALEDVFWAVLNSREFMFNH